MSAGPTNAAFNGDGFRFYRWTDAISGEETDVLSVTSIRTLCGTPFNLVNWQLANLADAALGTMERVVVGPRGGVSKKRQLWQYPSEFAVKYDATAGDQKAVDDLRKWLRGQADAPRNIAAIRGTIVHEAIEKNIQWADIERPYVEAVFSTLSSRDQKSIDSITDEDVDFVRNAMRQYWDMRNKVPFMIIGRELQVFNLTAGYAGSFDALVWVLPDDIDHDTLPNAKVVTADIIAERGGELMLLDWKTATDIHTDNVVQAHAYLSAEFVGKNGLIDHRMTDLLHAARKGALVHVRPDKWGFYVFDWQPEVVRAFLGSVAFARFLAKYRHPDDLFYDTVKGVSEETDV